MKKVVLVAAFMTLLATSAVVEARGIKHSELVGFHIGAVVAPSSLRAAFGSGSELELYFVEGVTEKFGIVFSASSHNFGSSKDTLANIEYSGLNRDVQMSIFSLTGGIYTLRPISEKFRFSADLGCGIYAVTANISAGILSGYRTENRFGIYGGAGIVMRISRGVSIDFNLKGHYVFIGSDQLEPIHFYTGDTSARYAQISIGVLLFGI